ncbi:MAG: hypothetical protein U0U33_18365 [Chitinophagaceae bacterium]
MTYPNCTSAEFQFHFDAWNIAAQVCDATGDAISAKAGNKRKDQ